MDQLQFTERALELAYGPRKLRVYSTKADILEEDGKIDAARATMEEAIRYAEGLPKAQVNERTIESLKTKGYSEKNAERLLQYVGEVLRKEE